MLYLPAIGNALLALSAAAGLFVGLRRLAGIEDRAAASPFAPRFAEAYERASWLALPLYFVLATATTAALGAAFWGVFEAATAIPEGVDWVSFSSADFFWAALPLGLGSAGYGVLSAFRGLFAHLYPDFLQTQQERVETDLTRLARTLYLGGAALTVAAVILVSHAYTYVGPHGIVASGLFDLEIHRYGYDEIDGVHYTNMVRGFGWEHRDLWRVRFDDGFDLMLDPAETADAATLARRIAARAGTEVRELTLMPASGDAP